MDMANSDLVVNTTQKILAAHAGLAEVKAGQLINAKLDIVLGNDITTPVAINEFERAGTPLLSSSTNSLHNSSICSFPVIPLFFSLLVF